jgi:hypothetical protein
LADSLRPGGGVSEGGTGIGAFGSLDLADDVAALEEELLTGLAPAFPGGVVVV